MALLSCSSAARLEAVRDGALSPSISITQDIPPAEMPVLEALPDTVEVTDVQGRKMYLMRAARDSDGEMTANDVISAVVVAARFRNVAERQGRIDLRFDVRVPAGIVDSRWQLRMSPVLKTGREESRLAPVYITGQKYRRAQLRGYQRYHNFLESIIMDSTVFIRKGQLEIFLKRNLPELYALRADSSFVSEERFATIYGVTEELAVRHYTDRFRKKMNSRRAAMKDRMFSRYVKAPFQEGIRLDTVVAAGSGDMIYTYCHTMRVAPGTKKAEISLNGAVFEEDRILCSLPEMEPLVFYISSLVGLLDNRERFLIQVRERRVQANGQCLLEFSGGSSKVDTLLGRNALEIKRISAYLEELLQDCEFDMDSIVVAASCSPEGSWRYNASLSRRRSAAVCDWFSGQRERDSVSLEFIPRAVPENWDGLRDAVEADSLLSGGEINAIRELFSVKDPDLRERKISALPCYRHLREDLYPHLRTVQFSFYRHRKGMVKDTVHTSVPDSVYMAGLQALRDCDYGRAETLLMPYRDINSAIACCAMDHCASALAILESLPASGKSEYVKAIARARRGEERDALQAYYRACEMDASFIHRGNLDPEISELKKKYQTAEIQ